MQNLVMPERGANMGDGWETKRRRTVGDATVDRNNDWLVLQLATKGSINKVLVDTCHFKGNYPNGFSLEGAVLTGTQAADTELLEFDATQDALTAGREAPSAIEWVELMPRTPLHADREHTYTAEVQNADMNFTHIRIKMYPDGGISRLRLWGYPEAAK